MSIARAGRRAPEAARGAARRLPELPQSARRSLGYRFQPPQLRRGRKPYGCARLSAQGRPARAACTQPSCAAKLRKRGLDLFFACHFPTRDLAQRLINGSQFLRGGMVRARPPRLNIARDLRELFLVLFRPSLDSLQNLLQCLGCHVPNISYAIPLPIPLDALKCRPHCNASLTRPALSVAVGHEDRK